MAKFKSSWFAAVALALLTSLGAQADDTETWLVVEQGASHSPFAISGVQRVNFGDDALTVVEADKESAFDYTTVSRISFTQNEPSAIDKPATSSNTLKLSSNDGCLTVAGLDAPTQLSLYSQSGASVMQINGYQGASVSLSSLPNGIYVLKVNNQTFKIVKK